MLLPIQLQYNGQIQTHIIKHMAKKVLFINQEISPYVPKSELSVMGKDLPHKMQEAGYEIRTFMPKWGNINERRGQLHTALGDESYN